MRNLLRGMLVVICCMAGMAAADEKNILVTSGSDRATPIAVVPFGWQGGSVLPDDMAEIIGNDLRNSGYYSPIPKQNMIGLPTQASEVIYRDWKAWAPSTLWSAALSRRAVACRCNTRCSTSLPNSKC